MGEDLQTYSPEINSCKADWKAAAALQCLLFDDIADPTDRSVLLSDIMGRPIIVLYQDEFPYLPSRKLTADEVNANTAFLGQTIKSVHPNVGCFFDPQKFDLKDIASHARATSYYDNEQVASSADGTAQFGIVAGIVVLWSKSLSSHEVLSTFCNVPAQDIEIECDGVISNAPALHEFGHINHIRNAKFLFHSSDAWKEEDIADEFMRSGARLLAEMRPHDRDRLLNDIDIFNWARTLGAFTGSDPVNHHTLLSDFPDLDFETATASNFEMRLMVMAHQLRDKLPSMQGWLNNFTSSERRAFVRNFLTDKTMITIEKVLMHSEDQLTNSDLGVIRGCLYDWCDCSIAKRIRDLANTPDASDKKSEIKALNNQWIKDREENFLTKDAFRHMERIFFGPSFFWRHHSGLTQSIPALSALLAGGYFTDTIARTNAARIIEAAVNIRPNTLGMISVPNQYLRPVPIRNDDRFVSRGYSTEVVAAMA